jgi:hypothetical protein
VFYFVVSSSAVMDTSKQLEAVMDWVTSRLDANDVPRVVDVVNYAQTEMGFKNLKKAVIARRLRLHPAYLMSSSQKWRVGPRSGNFRPIVANNLGNLHADLGFYPIVRDYPTPVKKRGGYLVAKDVLSRYVYVSVLDGNRKAPAIIKAFQDILRQHAEAFPDGHLIQSVGFDKETSVMSRDVQQFLKDNNIAFHAFEMSSTKSKVAERAIGQIRNIMIRLMNKFEKLQPWWKHIDFCVAILNSRRIEIGNTLLDYTPKDVNQKNLEDFLFQVHKADPAVFFNQFELAPELVDFKYPVGTFVRPKLLVTSSAVLGEKRSEVTLEQTVFVILQQVPYVTRGFFVGKAYKCQNLEHKRKIQIFDERDLAETLEPAK